MSCGQVLRVGSARHRQLIEGIEGDHRLPPADEVRHGVRGDAVQPVGKGLVVSVGWERAIDLEKDLLRDVFRQAHLAERSEGDIDDQPVMPQDQLAERFLVARRAPVDQAAVLRRRSPAMPPRPRCPFPRV